MVWWGVARVVRGMRVGMCLLALFLVWLLRTEYSKTIQAHITTTKLQ